MNRATLWTWAALVLSGGALACGGDKSGVGEAKLPEGARSSTLDHEQCSEGGHKVEVLDVNGDGKPDLKRVYEGSHEVCRIADMNHDGKPDMYEYFDGQGQIRRREMDFTDDGVISVIEYYEGGRLARKELDTGRRGKIDTWDFFDVGSGKRMKRERDTNGDGKVDQWWVWEGDNVTISNDRNGDGKPELESQITLGKDGAVRNPDAGAEAPAPTSSASDAGSASSPVATPTAVGDAGAPDHHDTHPDAGAKKRGGKR